MNMRNIDASFSKASEAMKMVVEISIAVLETDDKIASGTYITRLKDFADKLFDVTYSHHSEEDKTFMMEQAKKMKEVVTDNADSHKAKADSDS